MVTHSYRVEPGGPPARRLTSGHHPQRVPLPTSSGSEPSGQRLCWAEWGPRHSKARVDPSYSTLFFWDTRFGHMDSCTVTRCLRV